MREYRGYFLFPDQQLGVIFNTLIPTRPAARLEADNTELGSEVW
jgi:hypothetical protein